MGQVRAATAAEDTASMDVTFVAGESYEVVVRGHRIRVDQPPEAGGGDEAPTPVELFVASLATCVGFYAGQYLTRHGLSRDGLGVSVDFRMASDRPARVAGVHLSVRAPEGFPPARREGLLAVASHCTVHNSLVTAPEIVIDVR
ncbi:OsmC family protein [Micromonospora sp. NBC_00898]|uniref:OsmC family protein n=1 Tax=Micromonospora sp. NBC_00898 TaxID=2975981 RepID=UPI0038675577|nr:OsmC family protein [Micromonospora sp. NBC_00898]